MKYRVISVCIAVLALAAFQPFGLPLFGWMRFVHLLALGVVGVLSCGITEVLIMLLGYGRSMDKGIKYLVRRNQLFALVNTPSLFRNESPFRLARMSLSFQLLV